MCFSATASFGVSSLLAGIGAATLFRNDVPQLRMFAAVPLVFAAQQATEGAVWVTMGHLGGPSQMAIVAFLCVALVVWPTWLPLALRAAERSPQRQRILTGISLAGLLVGGCCALLLARWPPAAHVDGHHIAYDFNVGLRGGNALPIVAYFVPTIVPFFVSSLGLARVMGGFLVFSLLATYAAQRAALTSVWCFFASILSALILVIIVREQPEYLAKKPLKTL